MDTNKLKKFAQAARRQLRDEVASRLEVVLNADSAELREKGKALNALKDQIAKTSKEAIIARVSYTWFNRFCALRFMDANRYTRISVVSPSKGFTQPEILAEAKQGHIDDSLDRLLDRQKVFDLLAGRSPSSDPQNEAYQMLLVAMCNYYNASMPFLFERIADYTELLMPINLLSETSVLSAVIEALTDETCEDVEVIGWLYQFYISEKKGEVFEGLKENKKITPENIPAATQLFTPHWIVRYLVENSLGRLWMLNRPNSQLIGKMDYYIKPEQTETDFLKISSPEEIKICDPACGSGHMLVYAFDLLYAIYEEEGYQPAEIPEKILTHNLYGIEIDERAGELAAFALIMKARSKYRRFFNKGIHPNICVLENVRFEEGEIKSYMDEVGRDLFTANFQTTLHQFEEADNFGSLIRPALTDMSYILQRLKEGNLAGNVFLFKTHQKVLKVLKQADYLSQKYHVVVANPPYMGDGGYNPRLKQFVEAEFPDGMTDLYGAFILRNLQLVSCSGVIGMITIPNWMFLQSFEQLRKHLLNKAQLSTLIYNGRGVWGSDFGSCSFTAVASPKTGIKGIFKRLFKKQGEVNSNEEIEGRFFNHIEHPFYMASTEQMRLIPGTPIAFWVADKLRQSFAIGKALSKCTDMRKGLATGDNGRFLRLWHEVGQNKFGTNFFSRDAASASGMKWFPHNKGGAARKWYGNLEHAINWENDGYEIRNYRNESGKLRSRPQNLDYSFKQALTWSKITIGAFTARYTDGGCFFDDAAAICHSEDKQQLFRILPILNSKVGLSVLQSLNPTVNLQIGDISRMPVIELELEANRFQLVKRTEKGFELAKVDWDAYETSRDFTAFPFLKPDHQQPTLKAAYDEMRGHWQAMTLEMQLLEEENNRIFIEAYGLQDELTPEVPLKEITLTCNPHYRYGGNKSEEELEALLLADTMREFISYSVGCMFGRYSLDRPGLILANQGEALEDYLKQIPEPTFPADEDNVIPMLDGDWFTDDISERFKKFLRITFGEDHYEENLKFIENAIGKDIRKFFLKDFYNDHIKRYKKRPIYWLFSSPKGSFNALIYMHRYRPDTVSVILNEYLREFRTKLTARKTHLEQVSISGSASQAEKTNALKEIESLKKMIAELEDYEREVIYPLAAKQVEIDLDDGVAVNYNKFGNALKKIAGLS